MDGSPYYTAIRLFRIAADHWDAIDGEASFSGGDLFALDPCGFCSAIYWWAIHHVKNVERFQMELDKPPPVVPGMAQHVTADDLEQDANAFAAFAAAIGKPLKVPVPRAEDEADVASPPDT